MSFETGVLEAAFKRLSVPDQVEFNTVWTQQRRAALTHKRVELDEKSYLGFWIKPEVYLGKRDGKGNDRTKAGYSKGYIERSLNAMRLLEEGYRKTKRHVRLLPPVKIGGKVKYPGMLLVEAGM